jgi:hypothetical protein
MKKFENHLFSVGNEEEKEELRIERLVKEYEAIKDHFNLKTDFLDRNLEEIKMDLDEIMKIQFILKKKMKKGQINNISMLLSFLEKLGSTKKYHTIAVGKQIFKYIEELLLFNNKKHKTHIASYLLSITTQTEGKNLLLKEFKKKTQLSNLLTKELYKTSIDDEDSINVSTYLSALNINFKELLNFFNKKH